MPNLDATAVFGVIPDKLAIASAIRNPGFESNLDTPFAGMTKMSQAYKISLALVGKRKFDNGYVKLSGCRR
jgi:hypothetical protein